MIAQPEPSPTHDAKIVRTARAWRETEKNAIAAPLGKKNDAQRAHYAAKQQLREAVDKSPVDGVNP